MGYIGHNQDDVNKDYNFLHNRDGSHRVTIPGWKVDYPSEQAWSNDMARHTTLMQAHLRAHRANGPRWRVMRGKECLGRAREWGDIPAIMAAESLACAGADSTQLCWFQEKSGVYRAYLDKYQHTSTNYTAWLIWQHG